MTLREALASGVLIGDGANGTALQHFGVRSHPCELAILECPERVTEVHRAYLRAGASFIETNTFQANRFRIDLEPYELAALNEAGAQLARAAADEFKDRFVLGAVGPCGKPVEPFGSIKLADVKASVVEQAKALEAGGVDGFFLETYVDLDELAAAVEAIRAISSLPILVSKAFIEDGEAIAEGLPHRAAEAMAKMGADAIGANCIVGPQRMLDLLRAMGEATSLPIIAMPTPGVPQRVKGSVVYDTAPEYFGKAAARLIQEGASVVGGCCGTLPAHIEALATAAATVKAGATAQAKSSRAATTEKELPKGEPTELSLKLSSKKFIFAVEMDVPRGLKIEKLIKGARLLKVAGVDVVNISDGARARLRMNPSVVAHLIQTQVGLEAVMHFSCRDRNLLAIQADLLGCHALGVRSILAITGDPAQVGDYPSATSVFDVDAVGLLRILSRFNEGIDLAGNSIGMKCAFTKATAFNPGASDFDTELDRLKRKADAGADLIYTQPVFAEDAFEKALAGAESVGLPVFVGVLPLKSARHAEFMHNEVPGISIPDDLRAKIHAAASDADALEIGISEAVKIGRSIRKSAHGLYLMPPFGSAETARSVIEGVTGG